MCQFFLIILPQRFTLDSLVLNRSFVQNEVLRLSCLTFNSKKITISCPHVRWHHIPTVSSILLIHFGSDLDFLSKPERSAGASSVWIAGPSVCPVCRPAYIQRAIFQVKDRHIVTKLGLHVHLRAVNTSVTSNSPWDVRLYWTLLPLWSAAVFHKHILFSSVIWKIHLPSSEWFWQISIIK